MHFTKMHGCGNDYIYVNGFTEHVSDKPEAARILSDRHFGIGSDGIIFINPSVKAGFEMEMYNADGSRAEMCGNGIRCVGKYVYDHGMTKETHIDVDTPAGVKTLELALKDGLVDSVTVDMGEPILEASLIPVISDRSPVINAPINVGGIDYRMTAVSMGNPHCVVFVDDVYSFDLEHIGPLFEKHPAFPKKVNTEFVHVTDRRHAEMRVWERGSGETMACGTGACATAVACELNGLTERTITVKLLGGNLDVSWSENNGRVYLKGNAVTVFDGEISI